MRWSEKMFKGSELNRAEWLWLTSSKLACSVSQWGYFVRLPSLRGNSSLKPSFNTHRLWSRPSPRTWSEFLLQTSALTRIVLGLVDRIELSELVPAPQSSRGPGTLGLVGCLSWHQPLRQSSSAFRSIHGDLRSSHLDKDKDSVDETGFVYSRWQVACHTPTVVRIKQDSSSPEWTMFIKRYHQKLLLGMEISDV